MANDSRPVIPGVNRGDIEALKDGAAMMLEAGNRVAAVALLWSAVAIDPLDLAAHRRLAATLASGGDMDGAAQEYARYIEFLIPLGDIARATSELSYGASMLGGHPALHDAAEKIVTAVRWLVPSTNAALAPTAPAMTPQPALVPQLSVAAPEPMRAPRLLPKVSFRFCVHTSGDRHWMQLEGGAASLVPLAVRVLDREENVIETRLCIPLEPGDKGHARVVDDFAPAVAWVVVGFPKDAVAALDAGLPLPFGLQAKVDDEWLSLDLLDSGCRLGRTRANTAAS